MTESRLLQNREYIESIESSLSLSESNIVIVSAFLRSEVVKWLREVIPKNVSVSFVTRWLPQDILSGASDFEAFEVARKEKWGFYLDQDLHAKALLIDEAILFLGSANLTSSGTHLFGSGNNELSIKVRASIDEVKKIKQYVVNSYQLTMPMYKEMKLQLEEAEELKNVADIKWPTEIASCINPIVYSLWIDECFYSSPNEFFSEDDNENVEHDRELFRSDWPDKTLLKKTKIIRWLETIILESAKQILTFGYVTKKLHNAIITDPKPYRKDMKEFVRNLFAWIQYYELYDCQNFTKTIAIIKPTEK